MCLFSKNEYTFTITHGGPQRYSWDFISRFAKFTKRYIDDIFTVIPGGMEGPSLADVIKQGGTYDGMYPLHVRDFDGNMIANPVSIIRDQQGPRVHFLDMEIVQHRPGKSEIRMYDKRDHMPTLAKYRKFPHIETILSVRCKYATLHSQLCRFSYRCTQASYFAVAAARLIRSMWLQGYKLHVLRNKLHNFQDTFWRTSRIPVWNKRERLWYGITTDIWNRVHNGRVYYSDLGPVLM